MRIFFLLSFFSIVGCSTLPQEQCAQPDWERIGKIDGEHGFDSKKFHDHLKTCEHLGTQEDKEKYLKGWENGLTIYCTGANGYEVGRIGLQSGDVCDVQKYPEFAEQLYLGRKVSNLESEREQAREQVEKELANSTLLSRTLGAITGSDPYNQFQIKEQEINEKIDFLEKSSASNLRGTSSAQIVLNKYGDSFVDYAGAYTGTFIGFGIGHAIQGRYFSEGWKWTLADAATLAAVVSSVNRCTSSNTSSGPANDKQYNTDIHCESGPMTGPLLISFLGLRVWQSFALFKHAAKVHNLYAMPTTNGFMIGASF